MRSGFLTLTALSALTVGLIVAAPIRPVQAVPVQGARLSEPSGGFSYVPPAGWHMKVFPGLKYKISYAMPANGFAPNINVVDETAAVPLDKYMQLSRVQLQRAYSGLHVLSQGAFVTRSGLHGVREAIDGTVAERHMRQVFYVFSAPSNRKIIVTASWLASDGNKYASAADGAMKTFMLR